MTNPPFQDFLCNVYYMRSVGEPLVIYWLYVSYILVILLLRVSYRGVLRVNSGGTSTYQRGRPFDSPPELKPACLFTIFSSGYTPTYIFSFGIMKRIIPFFPCSNVIAFTLQSDSFVCG